LSLTDVRFVSTVRLKRRLKVEVFPRRTAAEIPGFTDAAKCYPR